MASAEMQLVCKVISEGTLKQALEWGVTEEDFLTLEARSIFRQMLAIYSNPATMGSVIGPGLAADRFPQLNLAVVDPGVTIDHLCSEIRNRRKAKELKDGYQKAIELADYDPDQATIFMRSTLERVESLSATHASDLHFTQGMEMVRENYNDIKNGMQTGVASWPWAPFQEETMGVQEDDYTIIYGRPKQKKTWVLSYLVSWFISQQKKLVLYTKEMTPINMYRRVAACLAHLPYSELRHGRLAPDAEDCLMQWVDYAKDLEDANMLTVLSGKDVPGRDTVSWLRGKVEKYRPDIVFVDGLYLMSPENQKLTKENERVSSVSRAARQMILQTHIPLIATMQANRQAAKHERAELDEIAFSDAVSQDLTMGIRVIADKDQAGDLGTCSLIFTGAREMYFPGMRINAKPAVDFSFHSLLSDRDISAAKAMDIDEAEKEKADTNKTAPVSKPPASGRKPNKMDKTFEKTYNDAIKSIE